MWGGRLRNKRRNNRQDCYVLSWKDKSLLIWVVGKKLHYWQEDRICGRGNISHIWPVHSITVGGWFSWAVYNNTCALYFPQINGNVKGATQDGCHRQVNLSTAEQRRTGQGEVQGPFPRWSTGRFAFGAKSVLRLRCLTLFYFSVIVSRKIGCFL